MQGEIVGNAPAHRLAGKGEGARLANGVRDAPSKGEMATKREMIFKIYKEIIIPLLLHLCVYSAASVFGGGREMLSHSQEANQSAEETESTLPPPTPPPLSSSSTSSSSSLKCTVTGGRWVQRLVQQCT